MKRLALLLISCGLLAGCVVPLDGAKCVTSDNCPSGQGCVNGLCVEGATAADIGPSATDAGAAADASAPGPDACTDDPACAQEGPACDPGGSNKLGTCKRVGGCLQLEDLVDCGAAELCKPGETVCSCKTCEVDELTCNGDKTEVQRCVGEQGAKCGKFSKKESCEGGLVCSKSSKSVECVCPAPGDQLTVDLAADNGTLKPNGAATPAACRFKKIGEALAVATPGKKVVLTGATELHPVWTPDTEYDVGAKVLPPVPFGEFFVASAKGRSATTEPDWMAAMGGGEVTDGTVKWAHGGKQITPDFNAESFPLVVPEGVTITSAECVDEPAAAECAARGYRILGHGSFEVVRLGKGASLEGVMVSSDDGAAPALVTCVADGATLRRVALMAPSAVGLQVQSGCDLAVTETRISGFKSAGVLVEAGKASLSTTTFAKNEVALRVAGGEVAVAGVAVTGGVAAKAAVDVVSGTLTGDKLEVRNAPGFGLRVSAGTVTLTNAVFWNGGGEGVRVNGGVVTLERAALERNFWGVKVSGGSCTLDKQSRVSSNMQTGIQLSDGSLVFTDSELSDNNHGLEQSGGTATITRGAIKDNARNGVILSKGTLRMVDCEVALNGWSGIEAAGSTSILRLEGTKVRRNASPSVADPVAGLVLQNNVFVEGISSCQFLGNYPTQIRVKTSSPWTLDLSAPDCTKQNVVGCYPSGATGVQVIGEVTLKTSYAAWPTNPPNVAVDYPTGVDVFPTCPGPPVCN